jgi:hypothetical protein
MRPLIDGVARTVLAAAAACAFFPAVPSAAATRPSDAEIFFRLDNPCPSTGSTRGACKGYVIDRVIPRICGGAEAQENMRWATIAEAKVKAKWDRIGCRGGRKLVLPGSSKVETEVFPMGEVPGPVEAQSLPEAGTAPATAP